MIKYNSCNVGAYNNYCVTDSDDLCLETVTSFVPRTRLAGLRFSATHGGVNNIVRYVDMNDGGRYILRIYNNGFNLKQVEFEHTVLRELNSMQFNFEIPTFLNALSTGSTIVTLSNNAQACMSKVISGVMPKNEYVKEIGEASGCLIKALETAFERLKHRMPECTIAPVHELYRVHHSITKESFYFELSSKAFDGVRESADFIVSEVKKMEEVIVKLRELDLPVQLIHGDLHYDNILVHSCKESCRSTVSGLLDFEFCSIDWRAMDVAICLSKYAGEESDEVVLQKFDFFVQGFVNHVSLTQIEIESITDLIKLRILSNVVYFVGRGIAKEDSMNQLISRIENYCKRFLMLERNKSAIVDIFHRWTR